MSSPKDDDFGGDSVSGDANCDDDDENEDEDDDDVDDSVQLVRVVRESEYRATQRATPTGLHLVMLASTCAGLDAWQLGALWGFTELELREMKRVHDPLIAVLQSPGDRWGRATAETLVEILFTLRPDEAKFATADEYRSALATPAHEASKFGLRQPQLALQRVYGIRDPLFGSGRFPPGTDEAPTQPAFFLDEKLSGRDVNPLAAGSSRLVQDYDGFPVVTRVRWE